MGAQRMALNRTAVINVVGLTPGLLASMPRLRAWAERGSQADIGGVLPAVTCSAQSTYLTGHYPERHGIVGNGWYFRDDCEVRFWRQSNKLVAAPKIWDVARAADPSFTCANLFWWFNMYSSVDYAVTPRPMYPADGLKLPDIWTQPAPLRDELQKELGQFPLFDFWGPRTTIKSSAWIAESARRVEQRYRPTLSLVYLPHLDYNLQRHGISNSATIAKDLTEIDDLTSDLVAFFERAGVRVVVLSEYGITDVSRPVHLNRVLREAGLVAVRDELGLELLDAGVSAAFAVADHQVAHVYVNDPAQRNRVRELLEKTEGVAEVLDDAGKDRYRLNHSRAGDFVAVAKPEAWFTYYYWLDDRRAPDFARTVDIHRKPGYDPAELFIDPTLPAPMAKAAWILAKKKLGFRYLMDLIPLDATLVKGSHGRLTAAPDCPVYITGRPAASLARQMDSADVAAAILAELGIA
jgi:predicted AlkP superfamily pyrophosphatase or phosphodiesterase